MSMLKSEKTKGDNYKPARSSVGRDTGFSRSRVVVRLGGCGVWQLPPLLYPGGRTAGMVYSFSETL